MDVSNRIVNKKKERKLPKKFFLSNAGGYRSAKKVWEIPRKTSVVELFSKVTDCNHLKKFLNCAGDKVDERENVRNANQRYDNILLLVL